MTSKALLFTGTTLFLLLAFSGPATAKVCQIQSSGGVRIELDDESGHYAIASTRLDWKFAGELGAPAVSETTHNGLDNIGAYHEINFSWQTNQSLRGSIRLYDDSPVVLFRLTTEKAVQELPVRFPDFKSIPESLHQFSFADRVFAPPRFDLETNGTPWMLFDDAANAVVISAADQFMITTMAGDGVHEMANALNPGVCDLPAGFSYSTVIVFGSGIHATWSTWGKTLLALSSKTRPANDADIGLRYLGYWTDNEAHYYYNYNTNLGYAGTLEKLTEHYRAEKIPIRYLQLDSWWYYKSFTGPDGKKGHAKNSRLPEGEWNRYGGLMKYEEVPVVLPNGLAGLHKNTELPLITHNRWVDPTSPYHKQYRISGIAAVDQNWWNNIIGCIAAGGVVCYEQDWLNCIYELSPKLQTDPGLGDAFTDGMARAAKADGLSLQYCMALPRFFLQGSRYDNLTTIRTSDDRFKRDRWDHFLFTSQLADATGIWPWTDVFMSSETNNLLISVLSAGMVGTGDEIGKENKGNLLHAARPDGVLVKPDEPLLPLDEVYVAQARGQKMPMVAWTYSGHGSLRNAYVFAYNRKNNESGAGFAPADLGLRGEICVYDDRADKAMFQSADKRVLIPLKGMETAYYQLAPVGKSGIAFFGDREKFVSCGRQRIAALVDRANELDVTVTFAAGEKSVRLFGFARMKPRAVATEGSLENLHCDTETGRFEVTVMPSKAVSESGRDPEQTAKIIFRTN